MTEPISTTPQAGVPRCVAFEDGHVLVIRKPAGWNTHAPSPYAGEGIYEWLRGREPRWSDLAIIHRLDKETSGLIVFGKTPLANRSLTQQFTDRTVSKEYFFWSDARPPQEKIVVRSSIVRRGNWYEAVPHFGAAPLAETHFTPAGKERFWMVRAHPLTGRTHQIRVHAAKEGFPILGDELYGGTSFSRMCLHAETLAFNHPETGARMVFKWPASFLDRPDSTRRFAAILPEETNAFRLLHGAADGCPGWYVDRLADWELAQSESNSNALADLQPSFTERVQGIAAPQGRYFKKLTRRIGTSQPDQVQPTLVTGHAVPEPFYIIENGVRYELSMTEGYSAGLFLDQRDNRRRLLKRYIGPGFPLSFPASPKPALLNAFAYTCGFSVCGALAGFEATSIDLSRKYLDWGRRNFAANGIDLAGHDWIFGDVFNWFKRLAKKGRQFDLVMLDPPTFSRSKESGTFNVEEDYGKLVQMAAPLIKPGGVLFASTNAAKLDPEAFCATVRSALISSGRRITAAQFVPQPPDFPITPAAPGYLKTFWVRLDTGGTVSAGAPAPSGEIFD